MVWMEGNQTNKIHMQIKICEPCRPSYNLSGIYITVSYVYCLFKSRKGWNVKTHKRKQVLKVPYKYSLWDAVEFLALFQKKLSFSF